MVITKIRQNQVLNLVDEIEKIRKKAETFETPVATYAELPLEGNDQGDLRVVLEDGRIYVWKGNEWVVPEPNMDEKYSKTIFKTIEQQTTVVNTGVRLDGVGEYITNNKYVNVHLNGQLLTNGIDFEIQEVESEIVLNFNYDLEPEDVVAITYGAKIMVGANHSHDNLETLSKITEQDGTITFDGKTIGLSNLSDGTVDGIQMKSCNATGQNSVAFGAGSKAIGKYSFSFGGGATAIADHSVCFGSGTQASGIYSFVAGGGCTAEKGYSVAMGLSCRVTGDTSIALGSNASASGNYSIALSADAYGANSCAIGNRSNASGSGSVAIGGARAEISGGIAIGDASTNASGAYSVALCGGRTSGVNSVAMLNASTGEKAQFGFAVGQGSAANASYSIAIGGGCNSNGEYSAAIGSGSSTGAEARNSIAFGSGCQTSAEYGVAFGKSIKTTNVGEVGFGVYNLTSEDTVLSIGNGAAYNERSNVFEIKNDGSILSNKLNTEDKDIVGALNTLLVSTQAYSADTTYEELKTNDKTIIGAINELYDMISKLQ